ncbi:hypothetical protein [Micromonospora aurantiaca (nom. illeg.)]|uniref:hypothetical protein n=1 Tax=Micromonospora aurantiaca (nom. illeg.) TaxID=47850 RepID=UPI001615FF21
MPARCAADEVVRDDQPMQRFDSVGGDLVVGTAVRARVMSHERWGVMAEVLGHETVGASVDAGFIDSPSGAPRALPEEYPPVGEQVDAVVQEISRYHPPVWIRLTMRAADLREFSWPCGCCGQLTILSPGGDGVTVDVRSSEKAGCASFAAHRSCLADRLNPDFNGDRARVNAVGRE